MVSPGTTLAIELASESVLVCACDWIVVAVIVAVTCACKVVVLGNSIWV